MCINRPCTVSHLSDQVSVVLNPSFLLNQRYHSSIDPRQLCQRLLHCMCAAGAGHAANLPVTRMHECCQRLLSS